MQIQQVARRLRIVVRHALMTVPWYEPHKALLPELDAPDEEVFEVVRQLPVLTKKDILANPDAFVSRSARKSRLAATATSGTTGTPLRTVIEPEAVTVSDALWWRRTEWAGYERGDWIARLVGDPVVPLAEKTPRRPYRISWTDQRLYLSSYHLSASAAESMIDILETRRPEFVMGYPSTLFTLATVTERTLHAWRPRAVLFSSEPMYAHQRVAIESFFGAPVRGQYGCAERVISASECASGNYHLGLIDGFAEGQFGEVEPDQSDRVIVSGLLSLAMPLLRYELGDSVKFVPEARCPCGRTLPVTQPVVTKLEDGVVTPSGRHISSSILTWAFKDLQGIARSQVRQSADLSIEILVEVTAPGESRRFSSRLVRRLRDMTFSELPVSVVEVEAIQMTKAGKTRFVVSEVGGPQTVRQNSASPLG
jgi:phenylacetate-CoA ligase